MANRHFGKVADVWKHLVLAEALAADRPQSLWDTHAGHAVYTMTTDAERRFGVLRFMELAPSDATLATSGYFRLLERHMQGASGLTEYPAGPMIAMLQHGATCEYCFCDVDPDSTANLRQAAARLGLASQVHVVDGDGMTAVDEGLARSPDVSRAVVYVDPFDHHAVGPGGLSALELCHKAADLGQRSSVGTGTTVPTGATGCSTTCATCRRAPVGGAATSWSPPVAQTCPLETSAWRHRRARASGLSARTCRHLPSAGATSSATLWLGPTMADLFRTGRPGG